MQSLDWAPEFQYYNAFNSIHPSDDNVGSGMGAFYSRGSGLPLLNGRYKQRILRGAGLNESLKRMTMRTLSLAKKHVLPILKREASQIQRESVNEIVKNLPELVQSAEQGGARRVFAHLSSFLPNISAAAAGQAISPEYEGSGITAQPEPFKHLVRSTMSQLIPLILAEAEPVKRKLILLENIAESVSKGNESDLNDALVAYKDYASSVVRHRDEDIEFLMRFMESLVDILLTVSSETYNHKDMHGRATHKGGFLQFLSALAPIIGSIAPAIGTALSQIPGPAGQILSGIANGVGAAAKAFGGMSGSGITTHDAVKHHNFNTLLAVNFAGDPHHLRHAMLSIHFPGLAIEGHPIDTTNILSHHLLPSQIMHIRFGQMAPKLYAAPQEEMNDDDTESVDNISPMLAIEGPPATVPPKKKRRARK